MYSLRLIDSNVKERIKLN